ncbi:MAG TPA: HAMP domain-containing sensor histidine kinase [Anaerolineales bacterium]|nr:HAMP domain-containing sensor histidine kinase [Anaerolineales bacterium]
MNIFNKRIFYRLLFSYIITIVIVMAALLIGVYFLSPNSYQRHMTNQEMMSQTMMESANPENIPGQGLRLMQGQNQELSQLPVGIGYLNFREAVFDSLLWAVLISSLLAFGISFYNSQKIVRPLHQLDEASREIANGNYSKRIPIEGQDEFSHLAMSFNRMSEMLEGVERTRVQMIGDISHELRTPLTIIHGYLEGMADGLIPVDEETYALMRKETERLTRLVNGLQELSRVESGSVELSQILIQFTDWIRDLVKRNQIIFTESSLKLSLFVDPAAEKARVFMDDDRMTQVLTNLLSNARQFSPLNSEVSIHVSLIKDQLEVVIKDQGIGISRENINHIFERFYQVERSRSNNGREGSGIGLSIAKALVLAHGGEIRAESAGPGEGTSFIIKLPIQ